MKYIKLFENHNKFEPNQLINMESERVTEILFEEILKKDIDIKYIKTILDLRLIDPNHKDNMGFTPLQIASINGEFELVNLLLNRGADPSLSNNSGFTPLHWATRHEKEDVCYALLRYNADPNVQTINGDTPLHFACINGNVTIVNYLLEFGADIYVSSISGHTPLDWAKEYNHSQIEEILQNV